MITERVMPIAMFLFFILIGINGFIIVAGDLQDGVLTPTGSGTSLNKRIGIGISGLGTDLNQTADSITFDPSSNNSATTSTSAGFSIFNVTTWFGGVADAASDIIGVKNVYLINNAINGLEQYMMFYVTTFPAFAPIFYAIIFFSMAIKILVFGYAGSILVRAIVGRGIF